MLKLFNTLGRKLETFSPVNPSLVTIFTCGPSVYQRAHIGNMRTFLFEDLLVRYLEYIGYAVRRGMIITDIEDKALLQAEQEGVTVKKLTDRNIGQFLKEADALGMKRPDYLPRASEHVDHAVTIIQDLLKKGIAYWHGGNVYFAPLKVRGFGKLFGLDMKTWPKKVRRFHKDTYPGVQWNKGDFILWHGCSGPQDGCWQTEIGWGRPSWNIQDASALIPYIDEPLSIYCGGYDNLYRHHDYTIAILESIRPYPLARFWLHGYHLLVNGSKMSKSKGNIVYTDMLRDGGFSFADIRFFLLYGHYRQTLNYCEDAVQKASSHRRMVRSLAVKLLKHAGSAKPKQTAVADRLADVFKAEMDNDLQVRAAFDALARELQLIDPSSISAAEAAAIVSTLRSIDSVLLSIFPR
jgi:cysteinyl-tRNA synthetase